MARLLCYVAILLFVGESVRAETDALLASEKDTETPRYIFMKQLYEKLADKNAGALSGEKTQSGTLLATGIDALEIPGSDFPIKNGSSERLVFTVPKQQDADNIQVAELWLFPDLDRESGQQGRSINIVMAVTAHLPHARTPRREALKVTWRPEQSCMRLDLTGLTKKIARNLEKLGLNESNVTVTLDVLSAVYQTDTDGANSADYSKQAETCTALQAGSNSSAPFLIVKYYTDSELVEREPLSTDDSQFSSRRRRSGDTDHQESSPCHRTNLTVNLTDVFHYVDLVYPPVVDIGQCTKKCPVISEPRHLTPFYYTVKQLLDWKSGDVEPTYCVPLEFRPMEILLKVDGVVMIYIFHDIAVSSCGCR